MWKKLENLINEYWETIVSSLDSCENCVVDKGTCTAPTCEENILRWWFANDGKLVKEDEDGKEEL